jgi:hypothetical protein
MNSTSVEYTFLPSEVNSTSVERKKRKYYDNSFYF